MFIEEDEVVSVGERGQVLIKPEGVYLYTHWRGHELKQIVQEALRKNWRWDDPEYLARIIFDVMVGDEQGEETSFGIGTRIHGDLNYDLLAVDCDTKTVEIRDENGEKVKETLSFEEFINKQLPNE